MSVHLLVDLNFRSSYIAWLVLLQTSKAHWKANDIWDSIIFDILFICNLSINHYLGKNCRVANFPWERIGQLQLDLYLTNAKHVFWSAVANRVVALTIYFEGCCRILYESHSMFEKCSSALLWWSWMKGYMDQRLNVPKGTRESNFTNSSVQIQVCVSLVLTGS